MVSSKFDFSLAHALARIGLGINIAGHGLSRIENIPGFANGMTKMFEKTWLSPGVVSATGYLIPPVELILGIFVILGLLLRPSLVVGILVLFFLTFGATLLQDWDAAGIQLVYIAFYAGLLATASVDRFSLDSLLMPLVRKKG